MIKVGITGGIGSGKTTVCRIFETLRVPVYYADNRAKELMTSNAELKENLKEAFGEGVYDKDGSLNRLWLASQVFGDNQKLELLNSLVHPVVGQDAIEWQEKHKEEAYTIKEAALLFEAGTNASLDKIIVVTAPETTRITRVMVRDKVEETDVRQRMDRQWPQDQKVALADYVINNDGKEALIPQVLKVHKEILSLEKSLYE